MRTEGGKPKEHRVSDKFKTVGYDLVAAIVHSCPTLSTKALAHSLLMEILGEDTVDHAYQHDLESFFYIFL